MTLQTKKNADSRGSRASELARAFVKELRRASTGELATLKRAAGHDLSTGTVAMTTFYAILSRCKIWDPFKEQMLFLAGTLFPINPVIGKGNFGRTMRSVALSDSVDGRIPDNIRRRFSTLIDSRIKTGELAFKLRQCVRLAASKQVGINWEVLVDDLLAWHYESRPVQRRWARSFFFSKKTPLPERDATGKKDEMDDYEE
ncbi:MAG: type I-E CRISPR-associated protein Cse2/CasB [Candidatus Sigynarchaeota archaeon]